MAQITELKHEDRTRRRNTSALAVVGVAVLIAGAGWLTASQLRASDDPAPTDPLSTPSASTSFVRLEPGPTVGTRLEVPLVARAPESWTVWKDGAFVWLDADGTESTMTHIEISGLVVQVFDSEQQTGVPLPSAGYADWLRENPTLDVIDEQTVVVDGERFPQLTVTMADDAPGKQFRLGRTDVNPLPREEWPDYLRNEVVTETVIEVRGKTMVVSAVSDPFDSAGEDQLDEGLALVLSTMKLPDG